MDIKCKMIKELSDGSAIVSIELDEEAKDFLIGEGFLTVVTRALETSESYIKSEEVKKHTPKTKAKRK
tara:strand:- start:2082 stop:2285 length:204 start_codon:yes stop_codon:yes gene_type:complete